MKANEAPEKIYLNPLLMEDGESIVRRCTFERQRDSQIEYTRTDAFIERAADWIARNGSYYIGFEQGQPCIDKDFIDEFKAVMKSSE